MTRSIKKIAAKVCALILVCTMLFGLTATASAEDVKKQQSYEIPGSCVFQIKDAASYDVFMNQASGSSKEFVVVSFSLMNLRTEPFYVKTETAAQLVYDGDFEYEADYLWVNPEGSYLRADGNEWLYVYNMDASGVIFSNGDDLGEGYVGAAVSFHNGYRRWYDPINVCFRYENEEPEHSHTYRTQDSSKTVLDPLVERTYHYVFQVPDVVAEDEGLRELILTVDGEEYTLRF